MTRRSKRKESEPGANGATAADAAAPAAKKAKAKAKEKEKKGLLESPELARAQLEAISKAENENKKKQVNWKEVVAKMLAEEGVVIGEQAARCRKDDMIKWLNVASRGVAGKKCTLCRTYLNKNGVMRQDGEAGKEVAQNGHAAY